MSDDDDRSAATAAEVVPFVPGVVVASSRPETLPGLDHDATRSDVSNLERSVIATLDEYREAGLISARDAGKVALVLELCRVMTIKRTSGRTSTYSNDARLLNEILDGFIAEEGAGDDRLREAMAQWSAYVAGLHAGTAAAS